MPEEAIQQMLVDNPRRFLALGEPVHLIAVEFSSASRNVVAFDHETA